MPLTQKPQTPSLRRSRTWHQWRQKSWRKRTQSVPWIRKVPKGSRQASSLALQCLIRGSGYLRWEVHLGGSFHSQFCPDISREKKVTEIIESPPRGECEGYAYNVPASLIPSRRETQGGGGLGLRKRRIITFQKLGRCGTRHHCYL